MDGISGFRRIFVFLVGQLLLLCACGAFLVLLVSQSGPNPGEGYVVAVQSASLFLISLFLFGLRLTWPMAASGVELFWGTSVKIRVERLLQPVLSIGAIALLCDSILLLVAGESYRLRLLEEVLLVGAIAAPLALSCLLIVSAAKRFRAYRRGHTLMASNLARFGDLERVEASIGSEQGSLDTSVRPAPQGFTFAGLTSKPWHDPADFPWLAGFEAAVDEIEAEFRALKEQRGDAITAYKYAGLEGDFWQSFQFATRHREIPEHLALCPRTASLLRTIPHYPSFRDAMFSVLEAGGIIRPHRDVSNVFLTMHLPLVVPGSGFMEVAGIRREWKRGEAMVFDSSYQHQAQNNSDESRVVLLVDFLHPELSQDEAAWATASRL